MSNNVREAQVAGQFYPASEAALNQSIKKYLAQVDRKDIAIEKLYGVISPHAGYPYSGEIAAYSYELIGREQPDKFVILAPSHRDFLDGFSIYPGAAYSTPLGEIPIEKDMVEKIVEECSCVEKNMAGHREE